MPVILWVALAALLALGAWAAGYLSGPGKEAQLALSAACVQNVELRRQAKTDDEVAAGAAEHRSVEIDELRTALQNAMALLDELRSALLEKGQEAMDWRRKSNEFQSSNLGILEERDRWMRLQQSETAAHGNAQACMMDFIHTCCLRLGQAGVTLEVPEVLRHTQEVYAERYLQPVLKATGSPMVRKTAAGLETAATPSTEPPQVISSQPENQA